MRVDHIVVVEDAHLLQLYDIPQKVLLPFQQILFADDIIDNPVFRAFCLQLVVAHNFLVRGICVVLLHPRNPRQRVLLIEASFGDGLEVPDVVDPVVPSFPLVVEVLLLQ